MLDFLHWSAALLALLGFFLWLWAGGIRVPQAEASAHSAARLKRHIGRLAIFAAVVSALLQAAGTSASRTQVEEVELWASASPSVAASADLPA